MKTFAVAATVAACATLAAAKPTFVPLIPGSTNVKGVDSIGHINPAGGGDPNAFGLAFYKADTTWTVDLCYADSDKDGQFNGAELGDPCCEWKKGSNEKLAYTTASAPGDATSKQDPSIWASVKCTNGEDPVTKYKAFTAKAGGASAAGNATETDSASSKASSSDETVTTPAPTTKSSTTTSAPAANATTTAPAATKSAAGSVVAAAASAVTVAVAAFMM